MIVPEIVTNKALRILDKYPLLCPKAFLSEIKVLTLAQALKVGSLKKKTKLCEHVFKVCYDCNITLNSY